MARTGSSKRRRSLQQHFIHDCSTMSPTARRAGDLHITIFITMTNRSVVNATKNITEAECFYTEETTEGTAP